jgi:hypothetical protein
LVQLQQCFKKPGCVTNVPAWWAHEFRSLDYVVFNLERRNNLHRALANGTEEIS